VAGGNRTAIGCIIGSTPIYALQTRNASNNATAFNNSQAANQFVSASNTNSNGYYLMNKTASSIGGLVLDRNGSQIGSNAAAITTNNYENTDVVIGALRSSAQFDNKECAGATIGLGLTSGDRIAMYNLIQALNTSLSRQV